MNVSGFNVEYGGGGVCIDFFLAEYARILFIRLLFCITFLGRDLYSFFFYVKLVLVSFLFIWVRGTIPRFRYYKLMYLAWRSSLPLSLNYLLFLLVLSAH
jgi:NADH-ubiquinone oxidoreductase chain 1